MSFTTDFIAGSAGGVAGMVIEYPFDTVKVLLQAHGDRYKSYTHCVVSLYKQDGVMGFYRGVAARTFASGLDHAFVLGFYKYTLRLYGADVDQPNNMEIVLAGFGSGIASALCLSPFELVKCLMQADDQASSRMYRNSLDCTIKIVKRNGLLGLYKGVYATFLREAPGTVAWCGTYDKLKMYMTPEGGSTKELALYQYMFAGGCAGVAYWTAFYPSDVVKTRIQVDPVFSKYSFAKAFRTIYKESGMRGLYRGWTMTAIPSFPCNAVIFLTYDYATKVLNKNYS